MAAPGKSQFWNQTKSAQKQCLPLRFLRGSGPSVTRARRDGNGGALAMVCYGTWPEGANGAAATLLWMSLRCWLFVRLDLHPAQSAHQAHVSWHQGDALVVNRAQVAILSAVNQCQNFIFHETRKSCTAQGKYCILIFREISDAVTGIIVLLLLRLAPSYSRLYMPPFASAARLRGLCWLLKFTR